MSLGVCREVESVKVIALLGSGVSDSFKLNE